MMPFSAGPRTSEKRQGRTRATGRARLYSRSSRSRRSTPGPPSRWSVVIAPLWWKSGMPGAGCTAQSRVSSARATIRSGDLADLELVHQAERRGVDLDELDPDVHGD